MTAAVAKQPATAAEVVNVDAMALVRRYRRGGNNMAVVGALWRWQQRRQNGKGCGSGRGDRAAAVVALVRQRSGGVVERRHRRQLQRNR